MPINRSTTLYTSVALLMTGLMGCGGAQSPLISPNESYPVYAGSETILLDSYLQSCSYMGWSNSPEVVGCFAALNEGTRFERYSQIHGLELKWGVSYEVIVDYWEPEHEIADGHSAIVALNAIVHSEEDPVGSLYHYTDMPIAYSFHQNGSFLGQPFRCGLDQGCTWIYSSAQPLNLTFEREADGSITLISADDEH